MFKEETERIFAYYGVGITVAKLCQKGILHWDLHEGNILFSSPYHASVADLDDVEFVPFPKEINQYASGIMNFFVHHDIKFGAAFRFGFIQAAGELGQRIFDILYNENDLTCLYKKTKNASVQSMDEESLNALYASWSSIIENSFINKHLTDGYFYDEYSFLDIMRKHHNEYQRFKKDFAENLLLIKHEYQIYLVNSHKSGNIIDFASACVSLANIELDLNNDILSLYYFHLALENLDELADPASIKVINNGIGYLKYKLFQKYGTDINIMLNNVMMNTVRFRIKGIFHNLFTEIWFWSDYSNEYSVESLKIENNVTFYYCEKCGNLDICLDDSNICSKCSCSNLEELEHSIFFERLVQKTIDEESKKTEEPIIVIPDLTSPEHLPLYLQAIKHCEKVQDIKGAIELCELMLGYINENPEIKDEFGYVLIKNIYKNGGIFREENDPSIVYKFFEMDSEYLRSDYEALLLHKLLLLYYCIDDHQVAIEHAKKIVEIANSSNRWIHSKYIETAYQMLHIAYKKKSLHEQALNCSQIMLLFKLIDENKGKKDFLWEINSIGEDYFDVGYFGISHICFFHTLRNHIKTYGIKHPRSAVIYRNIAKLYQVKNQFEKAFAFYAIAWNVKGQENDENEKLKTAICDCITNAGYEKTFDELVNEWEKVSDSVFKSFNEERYVEKNGTEMGKINLSSSDMESFITYDD